MIRFYQRNFSSSPDGSVIIETASGLGFEVNIPANSALYKHMEGETVKGAYVHDRKREDDVSLYGFSDRENLELFELFDHGERRGRQGGHGHYERAAAVGAEAGHRRRRRQVHFQGQRRGKKTAERIILELKG